MLAFVLGAIMSTLQLYLDYQSQEEELQTLINRVIEVASPPAARAVHTLDDDLSAEVADGLLAYDFIYEVSIIDELGNVLAAASKPREASSGNWLTDHVTGDSRDYEARLSIPGYDTGVSGAIQFKVDLSRALEGFFDRSVFVLVSGMFRNSLLVLLLFLAFYTILTRPLIRLLREIQSINPDKPAHRRLSELPSHRQDELAQLVKSTNQLLDSVENSMKRREVVEQSLRDSQEMISQVVNNIPALVCLLDKDSKMVFCNQWMSEFLGVSETAIIGKTIDQIGSFQRGELNLFEQALDALKREPDSMQVFEQYSHAADGTRHYLQGRLRSITLDGEDYTLVVANDMTDRKHAEDKMEHMAYHDALTGLPNRLYLIERLENEVVRSRRYGYYGAVLFIDLDHFKTINDSLGHPVGDSILRSVAERLTNSVRREDLVVRLSGDEFVVVLTILDTNLDVAGLQAGEVAEKIRRSIAAPYYHEEMQLRISCSIGIVVFADGKDVDVHELLRFADTAMYQVKEKGRDGIEFFNSDMADKVSRQLVMEGELHRALEEGEFEIFYQPKIDLAVGNIIGAEALLRWRHPDKGLISPVEFIPILEASGLILEVGHWVIEKTCQQLNDWYARDLWTPGMRLSVNISPRQFRRTGFVDDVQRILKRIPIPADSLDMEVTESIVIQNVEETISTLTTLGAMGISFSLDDFGTGYSSISYLKRLPVSNLKIDRTFVRDITFDGNDRVLVETIVTMAHMLDVYVIAEGVETREQEQILLACGCDCYQGFLFSRPVPASEFECLLTQTNALSNPL